MKAYFTVEAACILPIVFGVYVFLIYGMFYQYDRCLLEQDVALLVLRTQWEDDRKSVLSGDRMRESESYLAFEWGENVLKKEQGEILAQARGTVIMPFKGLMPWNGKDDWELKASYTCVEIKPTEWIRLKQKMMEETENDTDRICEEP